jgi:hypothetical protein
MVPIKPSLTHDAAHRLCKSLAQCLSKRETGGDTQFQQILSSEKTVWLPAEAPWELEHQLIRQLSLPLNLAGNAAHAFHSRLSEIRRRCKQRAMELPIA